MGTGTGDGASESDEKWEQFLRDSVNGVPDAPKEPSARARQVTRRLREEPGQAVPWRAYSPAAPRRRLRAWHVVVLVASLALLGAALWPGALAGRFGVGDSGQAATGSEPSAGSRHDPTPRDGTLEDPFRGSPAALWADGAAGIPLPAARATGWMSAAQVEQALARTRDFLVGSNLAADVLRGERPGKAIALINPRQQDMTRFLDRAFRKPDAEHDPLLLFSRFDASKTRLVGDVVKVRGTMTFREGERGALEVATDVSYVYPVVRPAPGSRDVVRTVVRRAVVASSDDPARVRTEPGTFSLVSYKVHMTNAGCGTDLTGYFAPEFGPRAPGEGPSVDPYDRSRALTGGGTDEKCGTATRS
ncbi:hypothetical protein [Streptomyces sp. NPDC058657]|uniref:hypothetical protein n=1 Tax=unclassified Streptomyces TaxID=2593676 RepID=UPI003667224D